MDVEHDLADRVAGRRIASPTLVLWAGRGGLPRFYGDVLEVWRPWAPDVRGRAVDARHFLVETGPRRRPPRSSRSSPAGTRRYRAGTVRRRWRKSLVELPWWSQISVRPDQRTRAIR